MAIVGYIKVLRNGKRLRQQLGYRTSGHADDEGHECLIDAFEESGCLGVSCTLHKGGYVRGALSQVN